MVSSDSDIGGLLKRVLGIAGVLACSFLVASAEAADRKSYQGGICRPFSENDAFLIDIGGLFNQDTKAMLVTCPLIRDHVNSAAQVTGATVEYDNPNAGTFSCTLYSQLEDVSGFTLDSDPESESTPGFGQLDFSGTGFSTTNGDEGTYAMVCFIPPGASLRQIYVSETSTAD